MNKKSAVRIQRILNTIYGHKTGEGDRALKELIRDLEFYQKITGKPKKSEIEPKPNDSDGYSGGDETTIFPEMI